MSRVNWGAVAVIVAIVPMAAGLVAQWAVMNEARAAAVTRDLQLTERVEALEQRVRAIETNRAIERQISDLTVAVVRVETELTALRRDVRGRER